VHTAIGRSNEKVPAVTGIILGIRVDLLVLYGTMMTHINSDLFFDITGDRLRGHKKKLFKRRFRLDIRNMYSVIEWQITGMLFQKTISSSTVNILKKHISSALEPETIRK